MLLIISLSLTFLLIVASAMVCFLPMMTVSETGGAGGAFAYMLIVGSSVLGGYFVIPVAAETLDIYYSGGLYGLLQILDCGLAAWVAIRGYVFVGGMYVLFLVLSALGAVL